MKNLPSFAVASLIALTALAGCATPAASETSQAKAAAAPGAAAPYPIFAQGTSAAEIRAKLGAPEKIEAMPSPQGHAEVWIYHFQKDLGTSQVAAGSREVQTARVSTAGTELVTVQEPLFRMVRKTAVITLSLLIFNERLEAQKATAETKEDWLS